MQKKKNQAGSTKGVAAAADHSKVKKDFSLFAPRRFTYTQLVRISDENYEVLNRNIDPMALDKMGTYVLTPIMFHHHAFGEPVDTHLRALISNPADKDFSGLQDLTFEQFWTGKLVA